MAGTQLALDKTQSKISNAAPFFEDRPTPEPMEEGWAYWLAQCLAALKQANLAKTWLEVDDLTAFSVFSIGHAPTCGIMATQMDMAFDLVHEGAALEEHILKVETTPYMRQVEIWAERYDREAVVMSPEELEALYDDAFFEAMDLEKSSRKAD